MKKILILSLVLLLSMAFVLAAKPTVFDSNGVEKGWQTTSCTTIQDGTLLTSAGDVITTGYDEWGYNYQAHMFNGGYCDAYRDAPWCQPWTNDNLIMKWNDAWLANTDCDKDGKLDRHYGLPSYIGSGAWETNHQSGNYLGNWDITGDWVINVNYLGIDYPETLILTQEGSDITGVSLNTIPPSSGSAFTIIDGSVVGDSVNIIADHDASSLVVHMEGTIAADGSMSGNWHDEAPGTRTGTWTSTSGAATGETCYWDYFVKIVAAPADAIKTAGVWYLNGIEIGPDIWGEFAIIQEVSNDPCAGLEGMQYNAPAPTGFGFYN